MEERQTNYTIAEGYELPSKGLIYEGQNVNSHVELRSMTARDEMKRLNPSTTPFKTLADIIENCMIEKPAVHVYDMAIGDYTFLLHRLRVVTYGDEYKTAATCPFCGRTVDTIVHLDNLAVKEFKQEEWEALKSFTLPKCGKTVTLKFQTPRLMDEITAKTKDLRKRYPDAEIDFETFATLQNIIDLVDGEKLTGLALEGFINKLPAADLMKIQNNFTKLNECVGIENSFMIDCDVCGGEFKTFFRYEPEFFRPTTI